MWHLLELQKHNYNRSRHRNWNRNQNRNQNSNQHQNQSEHQQLVHICFYTCICHGALFGHSACGYALNNVAPQTQEESVCVCECVCFWLACLTTACDSHISLHIYLSYAVLLSLSLSFSLSHNTLHALRTIFLQSVCACVCVNIFMQICKHLRRILFYKFLPRLPALATQPNECNCPG